MLKEYSLRLLQEALNQAIQLDPQGLQKITPLEGKVIEIIISPLNAHFYLLFQQQAIELKAAYSGNINTTIHSSPLGLIRLSILPSSKVRSLFNDSVKITGDVMLGQTIKKIFDDISIDWEGHLAHFTGDIIAHQIGRFIKKGHAISKHLQHSMKQNITEYVQEETGLLPTRAEIEDFCQDVDLLNMQVERIEAHINYYLHTQLKSSS